MEGVRLRLTRDEGGTWAVAAEDVLRQVSDWGKDADTLVLTVAFVYGVDTETARRRVVAYAEQTGLSWSEIRTRVLAGGPDMETWFGD